MSTLYELNDRWKTVFEMLYNDEIDEQIILDTLDGIEGEIEDKADNYAKLIKELEGDISKIKAEEKRLKDKRISIENKVKALKGNLQAAMQTTGKVKFKTTLFNFWIQKNTPSVVIDDETKVPHRFLIQQQPTIDKVSIKKALTEGEKINFARLEQSESIRIR